MVLRLPTLSAASRSVVSCGCRPSRRLLEVLRVPTLSAVSRLFLSLHLPHVAMASFTQDNCVQSKVVQPSSFEKHLAWLEPQSSYEKNLAWLDGRFPKRVRGIAALKNAWETKLYRGPTLPLPDPHDESTSKRTWEKQCMEWRRAQRKWISLSLPVDSTCAITMPSTSSSPDAMMERVPKRRRWKASALANGVALKHSSMEVVKKGHGAGPTEHLHPYTSS